MGDTKGITDMENNTIAMGNYIPINIKNLHTTLPRLHIQKAVKDI